MRSSPVARSLHGIPESRLRRKPPKPRSVAVAAVVRIDAPAQRHCDAPGSGARDQLHQPREHRAAGPAQREHRRGRRAPTAPDSPRSRCRRGAAPRAETRPPDRPWRRFRPRACSPRARRRDGSGAARPRGIGSPKCTVSPFTTPPQRGQRGGSTSGSISSSPVAEARDAAEAAQQLVSCRGSRSARARRPGGAGRRCSA